MAKTSINRLSLFNTRAILSEKRFTWLDYDKGISIILVTYGHAFYLLNSHGIDMSSYPVLHYLSVFLYGFRMPLFFFISGVLISRSIAKRGLASYVTGRADNILYPLLIWGGLQISLALLTSRYTESGISPKSYLYLLTEPRQVGHFWYLNALFFIGTIYAVLKTWLKLSVYLQLAIGLCFYCVSSYIHLNDLNGGMLTDICQFYLFFALGDLVSNLFLNENNVKRYTSWRIFVPLFVLFLTLQYQFAQLNINKHPEGINFVEHKMPWFYFAEALVGCALSISLSFLLQKYKLLNFLRVVGYHSLFIYCMQMIVMSALRILLQSILKIHIAPVLFLTLWIAGIVVPMVLYNVFMKLNMWWLFTFKRPDNHYELVKQKPATAAGSELKRSVQ